MKEILFRTRKGAAAWAAKFQRETDWVLLIRRDPQTQAFTRTKGVWVLCIPDGAIAAWHELFGDTPYWINQ